MDEPTTLPDGTIVDLVVDDDGDDLSDAERDRLHDALTRSWESAQEGRARPASAIVEALRA